MQVNLNTAEPGKVVNISVQPNLDTSMFKPGEMPKRILIDHYDVDLKGNSYPNYGPATILPITKYNGESIFNALVDNTGWDIVITTTAEEIQKWLDTNDNSSLIIASARYVPCANSDDFEGTTELFITKQSLQEYIENEAMTLQHKLKQFYRKDNQ